MNGGERQIHVHQVVVGDVVLLEPGEVTPCDGVFLSGHNVQCDESSATGESDAIKKCLLIGVGVARGPRSPPPHGHGQGLMRSTLEQRHRGHLI